MTETFTTTLAGETIRFAGRPGIPHWNEASPAQRLLAEAATPARGEHTLLLGTGHGALAALLARRGARVELLDASLVALQLAEQTMVLNGVTNARIHHAVSLLPAAGASFASALLELPKSRGLARRWLAEAFLALQPGGKLLLAGPNDGGIQPVIADAEALFGVAMQLGYKARNRVALAIKQPDPPTSPPWLATPGILPGTWHEFSLNARGQTLRLRSLPGIFSYEKLDAGTALLLEHLPVSPGMHLLDLGCGNGAIGLLAAKLGVAHADLLDVDLLAVAASRENSALNGIANARVLASDGLAAGAGQRYDLIAANLPFHVGKGVDLAPAERLIIEAAGALYPGGRLLLVANRFLRYQPLMAPHFASVERIADTGGYHLLLGTRGALVRGEDEIRDPRHET